MFIRVSAFLSYFLKFLSMGGASKPTDDIIRDETLKPSNDDPLYAPKYKYEIFFCSHFQKFSEKCNFFHFGGFIFPLDSSLRSQNSDSPLIFTSLGKVIMPCNLSTFLPISRNQIHQIWLNRFPLSFFGVCDVFRTFTEDLSLKTIRTEQPKDERRTGIYRRL